MDREAASRVPIFMILVSEIAFASYAAIAETCRSNSSEAVVVRNSGSLVVSTVKPRFRILNVPSSIRFNLVNTVNGLGWAKSSPRVRAIYAYRRILCSSFLELLSGRPSAAVRTARDIAWPNSPTFKFPQSPLRPLLFDLESASSAASRSAARS